MKEFEAIISRFDKAKILVVGDVMVDEYIFGDVNRISPEAPVPVVDVTRETYLPGGAANVASNIASLGGDVFVASVIGDDLNAKRLRNEFLRRGIKTDGLVVDTSRPTTLKTRVIAHSQQVVRVDRESKNDIDQTITQELLDKIIRFLEETDILVISDYGKGVITKGLLERLIPLTREKKIPSIVDPVLKNYLSYKGISIITPNQNEAASLVNREIEKEEDLLKIGREILSSLECIAVLITMGEKGMSLFEEDGRITHIPTMAQEVYDVTGAGDTVVGVLALALASGSSIVEAATLANYAAGIVVGELGTATVSQEKLRQACGLKVGVDSYHRITSERIKELLVE